MKSRGSVLLVTGFVSLFVLFVASLTTAPGSQFFWSRLTLGGAFFAYTAMRLSRHLAGTSPQAEAAHPWHILAERLGLEFRTLNMGYNYPYYLTGEYRGYNTTLHISRGSRLQPPVTRLEVDLKNRTRVKARIQGPKIIDEMDTHGISEFLAAHEHEIDNMRLFITSTRESLPSMLLKPERGLSQRLQKLQRDVTIEVEGPKLLLDHINLLLDVDYVHNLFDLAADIADSIEKPAYAMIR